MIEPETPYRRITVDGGEVVIPLSFDAETYNQIAALDGGQALGDYEAGAATRMLRGVAKDPERLRFGFYRLGRAPGFFWLPITFLVMADERWQRVFLERLTCSNCHWEGLTAFPLLGDLYIGLSNEWGLLNEASKIPKLNCPRCGNELPRHPIWIDPAAT